MADGVICTKEDLAKSSNGTGLVCLTRDQSIGLTLAAEAGCISLVAVVGIFVLILFRVNRGTKLIDRPTDLYILSLLGSDLIQALGAVMDIRWVNQGKVYTGGYCTAQGVSQQIGEPGVAIATVTIAIHTFIVVLWGRLQDSFLVAYIVVGLSWLFVILSTAISASIHTRNSNFYDTPTPFWCWIGSAYKAERIAGEYFWLWFALFMSVLLYVPLFFWARGNLSVDPKCWWKFRIHTQNDILVIDPEGWKRRSLGLIAYPLVYTVVVLPLSIVRWTSGFGASTRHVSDVATFITITIYSLSGAINVVLLLCTRPDLLVGDTSKKGKGFGIAPGIPLKVTNTTPLGTSDVESGSSKVEPCTDESAPPGLSRGKLPRLQVGSQPTEEAGWLAGP